MMDVMCLFFFSSRRRHTRCSLVTGVQTCALPIYLHEASWDDPALRPLFEPAFLDRYEGPSAKAAAAAARIITVSESSREQITRAYGVPAEHVLVAHNGHEQAIYNLAATRGADLVDYRCGSAGTPAVLYARVWHPAIGRAACQEDGGKYV